MRKDYCGPFWMPKFLRKWASSKFNASCRVHDFDYASDKYTQKQSDMRFLGNMIKQSEGRIFWVLVAVSFYIMVRIGGFISYKKSKKID